MNLQEAYAILEIPSGTPQEEAKKKYRELARTWHPDVNKSPEAETKFKKINEAYQCIQNGKGNDREIPSHYHNPFHQSNFVQLGNIESNIIIDFKESVLGCKKEIKYSRRSKCAPCNGQGEIKKNNGCKKCNGNGRITMQNKGNIFITSCPDCKGSNNTENCPICYGEGALYTDASVHVSVPAGVIKGNVLRLQTMGHYVGSLMGIADQHTDVFCHIDVIPDSDLSINGKDVVSNINISLLEALQGCERKVKTIHGIKNIKINPKSKNREEILIDNCGVDNKGYQKVILNVSYPDDINNLINILNSEKI